MNINERIIMTACLLHCFLLHSEVEALLFSINQANTQKRSHFVRNN
jgi:hypothetical protein